MPADFNLSAAISLQLATGAAKNLRDEIQKGFTAPLQVDAKKAKKAIGAVKDSIASDPIKIPVTFINKSAKDQYAAIKKKLVPMPIDVRFSKTSVKSEITQSKLLEIMGQRKLTVPVDVVYGKSTKATLNKITKQTNALIKEQKRLQDLIDGAAAGGGGSSSVGPPVSSSKASKRVIDDTTDSVAHLADETSRLAAINRTVFGGSKSYGGGFFQFASKQLKNLVKELDKVNTSTGTGKGLDLLEEKFEGLTGDSRGNAQKALESVFKAYTELDTKAQQLVKTNKKFGSSLNIGPQLGEINAAKTAIGQLLVKLDSANATTFGTSIKAELDKVRSSTIDAGREIRTYNTILSSLNQKKAGVIAGSGRPQTVSNIDAVISKVKELKKAGFSSENIRADAGYQKLAAIAGVLKYVDIAAQRAGSAIDAAVSKVGKGELKDTFGGRAVGLSRGVKKASNIAEDALSKTTDPKEIDKIKTESLQTSNQLRQRAEDVQKQFQRLRNEIIKLEVANLDAPAKSLKSFISELHRLARTGVDIDQIDVAISKKLAEATNIKGLDKKVQTGINQIERLKHALEASPVADTIGSQKMLADLDNELKKREGRFKDLTPDKLNTGLSGGLFDVRAAHRFNEAIDTTASKLRNIGDANENLAVGKIYSQSADTFVRKSEAIAASAKTTGQKLQELKRLADETLIKTKFDAEGGFFGSVAKSAGLATKRLAAFLVMAQGLYTVQSLLSASLQEAIKIDREFIKLEQVFNKDFSGTALEKSLTNIKKQIFNLGKDLGVSATEVADAAQILAQAGVAGKDLQLLLGTVAKSQLGPSFATATDTAEAAIAIFRQFNLTAKDTQDALGGINRLSAKYAVEAKGITEAVRRAGGIFSSSGDSIGQFAAAFTLVKQQTREADEAIATGLRNVAQRLQSSSVQTKLRAALGIDLVKDGEFIGFEKSIISIGQALKNIPNGGGGEKTPLFAEIREIIGGARQGGRITPLLQDFEKFAELTSEFGQGAKSIDEDVTTAFKSIENKLQRAKTAVTDLFHEIISSEMSKFLVEMFVQITTFATNMLKVLNSVPGAILAIGAAAQVLGKGRFVGQAILSQIIPKTTLLSKNNGGHIPGIGPNKDSLLAALTPGEFVLQRSAVQNNGVDALNDLNSGKASIIRRNKGGGIGNRIPRLPRDRDIQEIGIDLAKSIVTNFKKTISTVGDKIGKLLAAEKSLRQQNSGFLPQEPVKKRPTKRSTVIPKKHRQSTLPIIDTGYENVESRLPNLNLPSVSSRLPKSKPSLSDRARSAAKLAKDKAAAALASAKSLPSRAVALHKDLRRNAIDISDIVDTDISDLRYDENLPRPKKNKKNKKRRPKFNGNPDIPISRRISYSGLDLDSSTGVPHTGISIAKSPKVTKTVSGLAGGSLPSITKGALPSVSKNLVSFGKDLVTTKGGLISLVATLGILHGVLGQFGDGLTGLVTAMAAAAFSMYTIASLGPTIKNVQGKLGLLGKNIIATKGKGIATEFAKSNTARAGAAKAYAASRSVIDFGPQKLDTKGIIANIKSRGAAGGVVGAAKNAPAAANLAAAKSGLGGALGKIGSLGKNAVGLTKNLNVAAIAIGLATGALTFFANSAEESANAGIENATTLEDAQRAGSKKRLASSLKKPISAVGSIASGAIGGASVGAVIGGPLAPVTSAIGAVVGGLAGAMYALSDDMGAVFANILPKTVVTFGSDIATGIGSFSDSIIQTISDASYIFSENLKGGSLGDIVKSGAKLGFGGVGAGVAASGATGKGGTFGDAQLALAKDQEARDFRVGRIKNRFSTTSKGVQEDLTEQERKDLLINTQVAKGLLDKGKDGTAQDSVFGQKVQEGTFKDLSVDAQESIKTQLQSVADVFNASGPKNQALISKMYEDVGIDIVSLANEVGVTLDKTKNEASAAFDKLNLFFADMAKNVEFASAKASGLEAGMAFYSSGANQNFAPTQLLDILGQGIDPATLGNGKQFDQSLRNTAALTDAFDPRLAAAADFDIRGRRASRNASNAINKAGGGISLKNADASTIESFLSESFGAASGGDAELGKKFNEFLRSKVETIGEVISADGTVNAVIVGDLFKEFGEKFSSGALEEVKRINELAKQYTDQYKQQIAERFALENEAIGLLQSNVGKRKAIGDLNNKAAGLTGDRLAAAEGQQAAGSTFGTKQALLTGTGFGGNTSVQQLQAGLLASQQRQRNAGAIASQGGGGVADIVTKTAQIEAVEAERQNRLKAGLQYVASGTDSATHAMQEFERASQKAATSSKNLSDALLGSDDQMMQTILGIQALDKVQAAFAQGGVAAAQATLGTLGEDARQALGNRVGSDPELQAQFNNSVGIGNNISAGPEAGAARAAMGEQIAANNALITGLNDLGSVMGNNTANLQKIFESQFNNTQQIIQQAENTAKSLVDQISSLPEVIKHEGNFNINIVGGDIFNALDPAIQKIVTNQINAKLDDFANKLVANNTGLNRPDNNRG